MTNAGADQVDIRGTFRWRLTRRQFTQLTAGAGALSVLAACGGGSATTPTGASGAATSTSSSAGGAASPAAQTSTATTAATQASGGTPVKGGTLVYARNLDAKTLDPHFSAQFSERYVLYLIFNTLVAYDKDFNIVPDLAAKWEIDQTGTTITFNLQPNAKFHDGTACDATAVKWSIDRVMDPKVNSPLAGQLATIASVDVVDVATFKITQKQPGRPLLASLGERPGFIVSPTAVQKLGNDFARNPVGSGPFTFGEWVPDSHITVQRFDGYWDAGKPYLDSIQVRHVADSQVQATMIRTGEAQVIDAVPPSLVQVLKGAPNVVIAELQSGRFWGTQCDVDKPPFDNAELRKALAYGVDREEVKNVVFNGTGRVGTHPIGSGWAYDPALDNQYYTYDPEKAKQHLAASGISNPSFTMTVSNTQQDQNLAQLLQAQYQKISIIVKIETVDASQAFAMVKADKINWTTTNWAPRADPDGLLRILWYSTGFQNTTGYKNPELDKLLDQAAQEYDTKQAAQLYHQAEKIIVDNADYVFLHWPSLFAAHSDKVRDFWYTPDLILRLRYLWLSK